MDSRQLLASQRDAANQQLSLVTDMMMRMEEANLHLQQQNQTLQADNQRLQERNTTLQADNLRLQEQNRVLLASIAAAASSSSSSTPANRVRSGEPHLSPPPQQQQSGAESLNPQQQQQQPQVPPNVQIRESICSQSATFDIEPSASSSINAVQFQNEASNQPQSRQPDCHIAQPAAAANPEAPQPASLLNWEQTTSAFSAYTGQQQQQHSTGYDESDDFNEENLAEVKREIEEENEMARRKLQDSEQNEDQFDDYGEEEEYDDFDNLEHHQEQLPVNSHGHNNIHSRELLNSNVNVGQVMEDYDEDGEEEYRDFGLNDRIEHRVISSGLEMMHEEFDDQQQQQHGHERTLSALLDRQIEDYDEQKDEQEEEGDNGTSDVHQQIDPSIAHHQHHSESTLVVNSATTSTNATTDGAENHHHQQHQQQHGNFWIEIHEQTQPNWRRIMHNLNRLNDEQGQVMNANNQQQFNVNNANIQADVMMEEEDDDDANQQEEGEVDYGSSDHQHHQQQHQQIDPITNDAQDNQGDVIVEELCDECESRSGPASKQKDSTVTTTSSSSLTVPKSSEGNKRKRVVLRVDEDDYDDNFSDDDKDEDYVLGSDDDDDEDGDNYDDDGDEDEDAEDTESDDGDVINEDEEVEEEDSDEDSPRAKRPRTTGPTTASSTAAKKRPKQIIVRFLRCPQVGCADEIARGQLRIHLKTKHSIRPFACLLKGCARTFDNNIVLGRHMRQSHNKVTKWQCSKCPRHFTAIKQLSNHNSLTHQLGLFQCSVCTFTSENRIRVHRHYARKHATKRHKFVCKFAGCNRAFYTEAHLISHERSQHLDIKPFSCSWPHCGYSAVEHGTVVRHVRMRHLKLPHTLTEQKNRNIVDIRDPNKFVKVDKRLERRRV